MSTARDVFGLFGGSDSECDSKSGSEIIRLDDGNAARTTVSSSTDSMFSTLRRLAKVVVSLGQVISSFTRV